jgi:CheY-like chemotaxis protein
LIVDDDVNATAALKRLLEAAGYLVREENDSARASQHAREFHPDFVILDYLMPVVHGGDVAWQLASDPDLRNIKLIVCSGAPTREITFNLPPNRVPILEKPIDIDALFQLLREP